MFSFFSSFFLPFGLKGTNLPVVFLEKNTCWARYSSFFDCSALSNSSEGKNWETTGQKKKELRGWKRMENWFHKLTLIHRAVYENKNTAGQLLYLSNKSNSQMKSNRTVTQTAISAISVGIISNLYRYFCPLIFVLSVRQESWVNSS